MDSRASSSAPNPEIPEDILLEILSWLPSKSMSRFKCVSKHWNHNLPIKPFLLCHSRSNLNPKRHFITLNPTRLREWNAIDVFSLPLHMRIYTATQKSLTKKHRLFLPYFVQDLYKVSDISNGLVCVYSCVATDVELLGFLFSLRTRTLIPLPIKTRQPSNMMGSWCCLGFDPTKNEYAVLRIRFGYGKKVCEYEILRLGFGGSSNLWRPIRDEVVPLLLKQGLPYWSVSNSCCIDGMIYWIHDTSNVDNCMPTLAAYDLTRCKFRVFEDVQHLMGSISRCYLTTSIKGSLTMFYHQNSGYKLWKLDLENHSSSNVEFKISEINTFFRLTAFQKYSFHDIANLIVVKWTEGDVGVYRNEPQYKWFECYDLKDSVACRTLTITSHGYSEEEFQLSLGSVLVLDIGT